MRPIGLLAIAALLVAGGCSGEPPTRPLPDGVTLVVDQSRIQKQGREVFVRVSNDSSKDLVIEHLTLRSPRFREVERSGRDAVGAGYDTDLELELPRGLCGRAVDARATLTYTGDGKEQRSTADADDVYDAIAGLLDRDCAELTLDEAADVTLGDPRVEGRGAESVFHLPVRVAPTGDRDDVVLGGFEPTVLFALAPGGPAKLDRPVRGAPFTLDLQLIPSRCDPHALAEDKVGTLVPVEVRSDDLARATFYLPIGDARRAELRRFWTTHCAGAATAGRD